jgi:DNA-directed RNA polymerase sigma subunit (sigma70/sigma32)
MKDIFNDDINDKKAQFHEALAFLIETANINNGKVTTADIHQAFDDIIDDDSMYQLIYDYLLENKISIQGYVQNSSKISSASDDLSDFNNKEYTDFSANSSDIDISDINISTDTDDMKEKNFVDMYYSELENISKLSPESELSLISTLVDNNSKDNIDKTIVNMLIEGNLNLVIIISENFRNKGVSLADLIQEGNIGLMEGIMTYNGSVDITEFHSHLELYITNALNNTIFEQNASSRISSHVADRANELDRASVTLSKELDRTPTLEELAKYLSLPEDEVERIMKMSLNALNVNE